MNQKMLKKVSNIFYFECLVFKYILFLTECVYGTNKICTPFTYNGDGYDDCEYSRISGYWCLTNGQTGYGRDYSKCGECVEPIIGNYY